MTIVESLSNAWKRSFPARVCSHAALLAALFAAACGSVPKTSFYNLQTPPVPVPSDPKTDFVLGVEHFRAPEILRDDRIAYYVSQTQMNFYEYQRWASTPPSMVTEFTARWLESSGVFSQVKMLPSRDHVDYTLGGDVTSFEEVDSEGGVKVRLAMGLSLVRMSDRKAVWSGRQQIENPLSGHGVEGVASALNVSCAQALRDMVPGLIAQVEQDSKAGAGQNH